MNHRTFERIAERMKIYQLPEERLIGHNFSLKKKGFFGLNREVVCEDISYNDLISVYINMWRDGNPYAEIKEGLEELASNEASRFTDKDRNIVGRTSVERRVRQLRVNAIKSYVNRALIILEDQREKLGYTSEK